MSNIITVVISAAGLGSRLGLNKPKVLVEIEGKPILAYHFELLKDLPEVIVVVGFKAVNVIELVTELRPDTTIAFNHDYQHSGTALSVSLAARIANEWIISLDGDLLVDMQSWNSIVNHPGPCLGLGPVTSKAPVYAHLNDEGQVIDLTQDPLRPSNYEWTGIVKIRSEHAMHLGKNHVYQGLLKRLPMDWLPVDTVEVDEPDDLISASSWIKSKWMKTHEKFS